jgi:malonyl-CoA O-methyltransferase
LDEYSLDARAVRRAFDRASERYTEHAIVQAEIRSRLIERLDVVKLQPAQVLDLGAASGASTRQLKQRYPKARILALDLSHRMLVRAAREQSFLRRFDRVVADAERLPLRDESIDLVFSNLMLAWCNDVDSVFRETARTLTTDGLFMFTTLGPDTLRELRDAFRGIAGYTNVHRFIDMHDLGDALMRTGFAEPVMDAERLVVTYPTPAALFDELRHTGGINVSRGRRKGLLGRGRFRDAERRLESLRSAGSIPITVEVVYGHAWKGTLPAKRSAQGEVLIPFASLRRTSKLWSMSFTGIL